MRVDDDLVAGFDSLDSRADRDNLAAVLMAKDDVGLGRVHRGIHQDMQIRAADTDAENLDLDIIRIFDLGHGAVFIGPDARFFENDCFHRIFPPFTIA